MRNPLVLAVLATGLVTGCGKDSPVQPAPSRFTWNGTYSSAGRNGDVIIDVTRSGSTLAGEISISGLGSPYARIAGTLHSKSVSLSLDPTFWSRPEDLQIQGTIGADGGLTGTFEFAPDTVDATLGCRSLARRTVVTDERQDLAIPVIAIAFDGHQLWLSTSDQDYKLMDVNGSIHTSVVVIHSPNAHWTSSVLMHDGTRMWGVYPISVGSDNVADLLGFDVNGRTTDSLQVAYRPKGLAVANSVTWSLRNDPTQLVSFDAGGATTGTLQLAIPDAYGLAFLDDPAVPPTNNRRFWTVGWYLRRLYEVDDAGNVLSMCDLPQVLRGSLPAGLTVEGSHIWYAEGITGHASLHRLTLQ